MKTTLYIMFIGLYVILSKHAFLTYFFSFKLFEFSNLLEFQ